MELRSGAMPDEPARDRHAEPVRPPSPLPPADESAPPGGEEEYSPPDAGSGPWRAERKLTVFGILGMLVFAVAGLLAGDPVGTSLLLVAALVCALYALRGLAAPVRLAADADGLSVIHGYLGHQRLSWSDIEKITVDRRTRLGLRSEVLEIDTGARLYLLSPYDLSAEPAAVAEALARIRTGS